MRCVSLRTAKLSIKQVRSNDLKQCKMYDPGAVVMYGRVNNWPDTPAEERYHRAANAEEAGAESQGFADAFARTRLQESAGSSPSQPSYSLVRKPPVVEIDRATFRTEVRTFHGDAINRIANNPHEYSEFVSARAKRTAEVAKEYGIRRDSEDARYYSYQLGNVSVGLQRTEAGFNMTEFESDKWREQFPGRSEVTSIVDFQVAHPLVANAGDILLEHQLRQDGERPLVNWRPANAEAKARAETMGFVEVDEDDMVLDPTQSAQWTKTALVNGSAQLNLSFISPRSIVILRLQQIPKRMVTLCNARSAGIHVWAGGGARSAGKPTAAAKVKPSETDNSIREVLCNNGTNVHHQAGPRWFRRLMRQSEGDRVSRPFRSKTPNQERCRANLSHSNPCALILALSSAPLPPTLRTDVLTGAMCPS